jgi:pyrimidine operon attenuation protein/uracil phosphoribosyltransferase
MRQLLTAADLPADARVLLDAQAIEAVLLQMAQQIQAMAWPRDPDLHPSERPKPWLCGIQRGGVALAKVLADVIAREYGWMPELGQIDVTLYRDDTWLKGPHAVEGVTRLPGDVSGQRVLLVDDVLFTGRTIRAALNVLMDFGRPEAVRLVVLADRGGRELPVAADLIGHRLEVARHESAELCVDAQGRLHSVIVRPKNP